MKLVQRVKLPCLVLLASLLASGCSSSSSNQDSTEPSKVKKVDLLEEDSSSGADTSGSVSSETSGEKSSSYLKRNFYFVFDGSGSMKDAPPASDGGDTQFNSKIVAAKWAVREFLQKVPQDVNLGLFVFDRDGERQVIPLGPNNRAQFLAAIERIRASGGTPLGDAINQGATALAKQYKRQMGYGDYRLIVITDGEASDHINTGIAQAAKYNIPIYTIGFGIGPNHSLRKYSISYRSADSAQQVKSALEEAAAELDVFDAPTFKKK
ncbi:MAG TPA: vWA domain-containing protein [Oculatellaceae cyanobacterium]